MNLSQRLQHLYIQPNSEFTLNDFSIIALSEGLEIVNIPNCLMSAYGTKSFKFDDLRLSSKEKLTIVNISGTQGIDWLNSKIDLSKSELLTTVNLSNCGLDTLELNYILIELSKNADSGMGFAQNKSKTISLNGANNKAPDLNNPNVISAKNNLISKGFTVNHN